MLRIEFFFGGFMKEFLLFIFTFIVTLIFYELFVVSKTKKKIANGVKVKDIVEIRYLVNRYNLDMKKIDYNQLLQLVALLSSFDISIVISIMLLINNFVLEIIFAFVGIIISILLSYHLIYLFYKKKGMIKND
jgi:hypothetical protein